MSRSETAAQKLAELQSLSNEAGSLMFRRATIAMELLEDKGWIQTTYRGDTAAAREMLETQYFSDICGLLTVSELVDIRTKFPKQEQWAKCKWNLRELNARAVQEGRKANGTSPPAVPHKPKAAEVKEIIQERDNLKAKLADMSVMLKNVKDVAKEKESEVAKLQKENMALRSTVKNLEDANEKMKKRLDQIEKRELVGVA